MSSLLPDCVIPHKTTLQLIRKDAICTAPTALVNKNILHLLQGKQNKVRHLPEKGLEAAENEAGTLPCSFCGSKLQFLFRYYYYWAGHIVRMKASRSAFKILTVTPPENIPLGRPRCRMELKEIGINTSNWVDSVQDMYWTTLVNAAFNLRVP